VCVKFCKLHLGREMAIQRFLTLAAILGLASLCLAGSSCKPRKIPAEGAVVRSPFAVILRGNQQEDDLNIRAYERTFAAINVTYQTGSLSYLEALPTSDVQLILVVPGRTARQLNPAQVGQIVASVECGAVLISEGITPLSQTFGFRAGKTMRVKEVKEEAYPEIPITWEQEQNVPSIEGGSATIILTREAGSGAALASLVPHVRGFCLLLAAELDPDDGEGYARFPYLLQSLRQAGVRFPFRSERLSAFFDYGYRFNSDLEALVKNWVRIGITAIHVGAWHFYDGQPATNLYLDRLISICHRNGILVYAWLELPHVSFRFWEQHPEWREKTALGMDAKLDWRYLMNLKDPACFASIASGLQRLLRSFDWDGVNLSELYFESPVGAENPEEFTPLNSLVRAEFKTQTGVDPMNFFREKSPNYWRKDGRNWAKFVDYRVELERILNERFLQMLSGFGNASNTKLGIYLTYIDNLYDPKMREGVGADIEEILPLLERYDFKLVMEDPGSVWNAGPRRYMELAQSYAKLTDRMERLGIDINIVERIQRVYPTQKQTGTEFLQLFQNAGKYFQTVLVYSEQTMLLQDAEFVSCALASNVTGESLPVGMRVTSDRSITYRAGSEAADFSVDGSPWPCVSHDEIRLPAGSHLVSAVSAGSPPKPRLVRLNGDLIGARYAGDHAIEFSYSAQPSALAIFDRPPRMVRVDGNQIPDTRPDWLRLPGGTHQVRADF
jgi:hypothetical protein